MAAPSPAGWYPDPTGSGGQRYWDGTAWTPHYSVHMDVSGPPLYGTQHAPVAPQPAGVVVTGPNHALHAILSLLTFWACGGWIWIWLLVALDNKKVQPVDALGNPIPLTGAADRSPAGAAASTADNCGRDSGDPCGDPDFVGYRPLERRTVAGPSSTVQCVLSGGP
jgi:hypothetical protein